MERILCAAIYYQNGIEYVHQPKNISTGIVVCGWRHHNCIQVLSEMFPDGEKTLRKQGFLTQSNRFVDREEGGSIAFAAGQTETQIKRLHSEDLY
jgi:hypothetical protein